jgi:SWI/SNF-related matrix-associated actin-dependent regulator 1 of chromatin subfamily A
MTTLNDLLGGAAPDPTPAPAIEPVDLALPLLDHQVAGVEFALRNRVSLIAHDMGTGKTATGIGVIAALIAAGEGPVLVVVPPSLRTNWAQREIPRFAPNLKVVTVTGTKPYDLDPADVYVIGDSSVSAWADAITGQVPDGKDRRGSVIYKRVAPPLVKAIVVDESHRAKNRSQRTAAMVRIANACGPYRMLMSGTPAPNGRNIEFGTQIDILGAEAWAAIGGRGRFWGHYCPKVDAWGTRGNNDTEGLHAAMTGSWMQRLLRDDVLDLPHKGRNAVAVATAGKPGRDYTAAEDDLIRWLAEEGLDTRGAERAEALVRLTTLRRLAGEAKVKAAVEHIKGILDEVPGGVFVVAEHHAVMDGLMLGLAKYSPVSVRGGMSDADKQSAVDEFNSGASRVMVGQVTAAGVGLTLHGDGKNHRVVVVQLPWTPADLGQAEDRLHRIGQTSDVHVEILLAHIEGRWTIDERLWGMLESKYFNAKELVDGNGEFMLSDVQDGILDSYR